MIRSNKSRLPLCLIALMPLSDSARLMDLVKLRGVVEGSRRSILYQMSSEGFDGNAHFMSWIFTIIVVINCKDRNSIQNIFTDKHLNIWYSSNQTISSASGWTGSGHTS
jgi:hypothetical protein